MSVQMTTPRSQVRGLGSAKSGTGHWIMQRLTAFALIPLTILFVLTFMQALEAESREAALALYRNPFDAIVAALFVATVFYHLKLGLQVVIEDYVHAPFSRMTLLICNALGCAAVGAAGVFAIMMIAV